MRGLCMTGEHHIRLRVKGHIQMLFLFILLVFCYYCQGAGAAGIQTLKFICTFQYVFKTSHLLKYSLGILN